MLPKNLTTCFLVCSIERSPLSSNLLHNPSSSSTCCFVPSKYFPKLRLSSVRRFCITRIFCEICEICSRCAVIFIVSSIHHKNSGKHTRNVSRRFADFLLFDLNRFAVFDLLFELIYNVSMATTAVFLPKKRVFGPVRVDLRLVLGLDELNAGVVVLITANKSRHNQIGGDKGVFIFEVFRFDFGSVAFRLWNEK